MAYKLKRFAIFFHSLLIISNYSENFLRIGVGEEARELCNDISQCLTEWITNNWTNLFLSRFLIVVDIVFFLRQKDKIFFFAHIRGKFRTYY